MKKVDNSALSSKYLVIGLDGATPEILERMLKNNELPTIKRLMDQGTYAPIRSTLPPVSPAAWTSMTTGVVPGTHGITGFDQRKDDSYSTQIFNSSLRRAKPIWVLLSEIGKRVGVINVPMTYPPDQVNGTMISGLGTPGEDSSFTHPPELKSELIDKIGRLPVSHVMRFKKENIENYIKYLRNSIENHFNSALYCMSKYDYDFFMVVFTALDEASHFLWHLTDEKHPSYNKSDAERFGDVISDLYRTLDLKAEKLIKNFGKDATVIVVSDHGFGPLRKAVSVNLLFEELGLLKFHHRSGSTSSKLNQFRVKTKAYMAKRRAKLSRLCGLSGEQNSDDMESVGIQFLDLIDWPNTKAYSMDDCGSIFFNIKGREPLGMLEEGPHLNRLKEDIKKKLLALRDPESGQPMVKDVIFKEDVYPKKGVQQVPDIFTVWEKGYGAVSGKAIIKRSLKSDVGGFFVQHNWSGHHAMDGIFVLSGPNTKSSLTLERVQMYDVFPTILYSMGLPLPDGLDGRVLKECFNRTILEKYSSTSHIISSNAGRTDDMSDDEQDRVMERLKSLGYLE